MHFPRTSGYTVLKRVKGIKFAKLTVSFFPAVQVAVIKGGLKFFESWHFTQGSVLKHRFNLQMRRYTEI